MWYDLRRDRQWTVQLRSRMCGNIKIGKLRTTVQKSYRHRRAAHS